jgi:hypothetical protein
VQVLR